jgi:SAM-dependent methyltransferase
MFSDLRFICGELWRGKSVLRAYLNQRLKTETLRGKTIDIGGGKNADYISFMKETDNCELVTFDNKSGATVDFETDRLPAEDGAYDTVLFLNVMEHIYNHQHISREVLRIVKPGGQLVGFVPFLMWYHADHRDFFRYTHEALEKILERAGATNYKIEMIGAGPFIAASHMVLQSFPRVLRVPLFLFHWTLDSIYQRLKGSGARPYALGYLFTVTKS